MGAPWLPPFGEAVGMGGPINRSTECSVTLVREFLDYDPETGVLTWRVRSADWFRGANAEQVATMWNATHAGRRAFTATDKDGYQCGSIFNRVYRAQRVCFAHFHGYWPDEVDHGNGIRSDNRIANLSDAGSTGNMRNRAMDGRNKTGVMGVKHLKTGNLRWQARIGSPRTSTFRQKNFATKGEAVEQRLTWERELGYHLNHGKRERHGV